MKTHMTTRRAFGRVLSLAALFGVTAALTVPEHALALDAARAPAHQRPVNAVVHWNSIAAEAFAPSQGTNPMAQSRTLAILHASMHDALNAIDRRYQPYTPGLPKAPKASPDAAVAAAAREVLVRLLPEQATLVETAYGRALMNVRDGAAKTAGIATGQAAAWATMNRRQGDGADSAGEAYVPRPGPGEYQFTAPFNFAALPGWGRVQPFVIDLREHTELFGDKQRYGLTSLTLPGVTRHYRGFSQAAQENGLSRIYAGIHFRHAVKDGRRQGRSIGQSVAEALAPVR